MINSKNALIKALKLDKSKIKFKTVVNKVKTVFDMETGKVEGYMVGVIRNAGDNVQTNAFTIETFRDNERVNSWVYLNDIEVKNNRIIYKNMPIEIEIIEEAV